MLQKFSCITFLFKPPLHHHIPFNVKEFRYTFFTFPSKVSTSRKVFLNISQYSQETPVLESLFNKVAGLRTCTLLKRDSNTGVLPLNLRNL